MSLGTTTARSETRFSWRVKTIAGSIVIIYAVLSLTPLAWIVLTGFTPTGSGILNFVTPDFALSFESYAKLLASPENEVQPSAVPGLPVFVTSLLKSIFIGVSTTVLAVIFGTLAAYGLSRFKVPLKDNLLLLVLLTRLIPPLVVAIPISLVYREFGLTDTHAGLIVLHTAMNMSLAVWLMKRFFDEIPVEFEEAAMIAGYSRFQAFRKVVLPLARGGMMVTAVLCFIFSWNEFAFSMLFTADGAQTAPVMIASWPDQSRPGWPLLAAGTTIIIAPVLIFTLLLRRHLARGLTFGAVAK